MEVASMATPAAVVGTVGAAVMLGDAGFKLECRRRRGEVGKMTILTTTAGPFADKLALRLCHSLLPERLRKIRALACKMAMKSMMWTYASYSRRSLSVSSPSLHLSASLSIRA